MNNGIDLYNKLDELADKIDNVLSEYGLKIGVIYGQYKNPVELKITVEEKEVQDYVRDALKEALKDDDRFWDCIKSQMTVEEDTDFGFTPDGAFDWVHKYGCYLWVDNPEPYVKVEIAEQDGN